jgi:diamine N-acetyltransferase
MEVELKEITAENFDECVLLDVAEHQKGFVATNLMSIAQSKVYPTLESKAVYADGKMVGFVMYGFSPDTGRFTLARLMIDARWQGEGLGRASTKKVLETLRDREGCDSVYLSFVPENSGAEALYRSIGFERTGETDKESGEIIMRYSFK